MGLSRVRTWEPGLLIVGRHVNSLGYVVLRFAGGGEILEHRFVMQNHLGFALTSTQIVHHKDENRAHNKIENLKVVTSKVHRYIHGSFPGKCPVCNFLCPSTRAKYCSRACMAKGMAKKAKLCWSCKERYKPAQNYKRNKFCNRGCYNTFVRRVGREEYRRLRKEVS